MTAAFCCCVALWANSGLLPGASLGPRGGERKSGTFDTPITFEPNQGQAPAEVKFLYRDPGYSLYFYVDRVEHIVGSDTSGDEMSTVTMRFEGANRQVKISGSRPRPGTSNYFEGTDKEDWTTGVPHFGPISYQSIYPGIDLVFYGQAEEIEYDFVVHPGADLRKIRLSYDENLRIRITETGDLAVETAIGRLVHRKPLAYQPTLEAPPISAVYHIEDDGHISFRVADYDPGYPLVIDPVVTYSSYLRDGSMFGAKSDLALHAKQHAFIATTIESYFYRPQGRSYYTYTTVVTKIDWKESEILYRAFVSASTATGIAIDAHGNAYVTGRVAVTSDTGFPVTEGALATSSGRGFVSKLTPDGQDFVYSTRFSSDPASISVDAGGAVYLTGSAGEELATTDGAFKTELGSDQCTREFGGEPFTCPDAFVAKLAPDGSSLSYSTFLGGSGEDMGLDIAIDASGSAYVVGETRSEDFPSTLLDLGGLFGSHRILGPLGSGDGFVAKLSPDGAAIVYSSYLGGSEADIAFGVDVNTEREAVVVGTTQSPDFPTRGGSLQSAYGGGSNEPNLPGLLGDGFVTRFDSSGHIAYSTFLGAAGNERLTDVKIDPEDRAYASGMVVYPGGIAPPCAASGFAVVIGRMGDEILYRVGVEGITGSPHHVAIELGAEGDAFLLGRGSTRLLEGRTFISSNALSEWGRNFFARVDFSQEDAPMHFNCVLNAASYRLRGDLSTYYLAVSPGAIVSVFGRGLGPTEGVNFELDELGRVPRELAGTRVFIGSLPAPILYAQNTQVNAIIPWDLPDGPTGIRIESTLGEVGPFDIEVNRVVPGVFVLGGPDGESRVLNEDGSVNSPENPAKRGSVIVMYATGFGRMSPQPEDGALIPVDPPWPSLTEEVRLFVEATTSTGSTGMPILYRGPAPGLVAGVVQINAQIPENAKTGDSVILRFTFDDAPQPGFQATAELLRVAIE